MTIARIDNSQWIRCRKCGHKLGRIIQPEVFRFIGIEIKCHSCRELNILSETHRMASESPRFPQKRFHDIKR